MKAADFEIRRMTEMDLDTVAEMEAGIFSQPWSRQGFLDALNQEYTLYLTVMSGDEIVGYCGLQQSFDEADITNVAVKESFRGCGLGERMLKRLMEKGAARGIVRYTLEVRKSNAPAIHLYEKLGFVSAGIRKNFYEKPCEDAVIMWLAQKPEAVIE